MVGCFQSVLSAEINQKGEEWTDEYSRQSSEHSKDDVVMNWGGLNEQK